jgi:hypothetical protein
MKKIYSLIFISILAFSLSCSKRENPVESIETGSDLSSSGKIKNNSIEFLFPEFIKGGEVKDLFNYIYFKGDTICFSVKADIRLNQENTSVYFVNPADEKRYKAERLDFHGNSASGFSLVGSVMEQFYSAKLNEPIPEKKFCCEYIPFEIFAVIDSNNKKYELRKKGKFIIRYY